MSENKDQISNKAGKEKKDWNVDLIKAILDFLGKGFYPLLILTLIITIKPLFNDIDIKKMISRIQTAKIGGYELSFSQVEDVAAETAPLNNKIAILENKLTLLQNNVETYMKESGTIQDISEEQKTIQREFTSNSKYTVLVFHWMKSRNTSNILANYLIKNGYKSSNTETDFKELNKVTPEVGTIYLTYNQAGQILIPEIEAIIKELFPEIKVKVNPRAIQLRRGDMQVLVF